MKSIMAIICVLVILTLESGCKEKSASVSDLPDPSQPAIHSNTKPDVPAAAPTARAQFRRMYTIPPSIQKEVRERLALEAAVETTFQRNGNTYILLKSSNDNKMDSGLSRLYIRMATKRFCTWTL